MFLSSGYSSIETRTFDPLETSMWKQPKISAHIKCIKTNQKANSCQTDWKGGGEKNHLFQLNFSIKAPRCVISTCVIFNTAVTPAQIMSAV